MTHTHLNAFSFKIHTVTLTQSEDVGINIYILKTVVTQFRARKHPHTSSLVVNHYHNSFRNLSHDVVSQAEEIKPVIQDLLLFLTEVLVVWECVFLL